MSTPHFNATKAAVLLFLFLASSTGALGQAAGVGVYTNSTVSSSSAYTAIFRDANSCVWQQTTAASGRSQVVAPASSYIELADGLNFKDSITGQWVPSKEEIDILPDGNAAATNGQHQAYFPADIASGVIRLVTPDGLQLQSQPIALSLSDGSNTVLIAELTNSVGELVSQNQAIYTNAFTGINADLLYTYTKAGLEQDVILNQQPPAAASFGLNPQTTRLQMVTEFFNPPQPTISSASLPQQSGVVVADDTLDFGMMEMIQGRAFLLGEDAQEPQVFVGKQWLSANGRQFLFEEVPLAAITNQLSQLSSQTAAIKSRYPLYAVSAKPLLPPRRLAKSSPRHQMRIARAELRKGGLLLDYQIVNTGMTGLTFCDGMTYYVSGTVMLYGTNVFEGGTVIKYATNAEIAIRSTNGIISAGSQCQPVIFTAKDDNTIGQTINGSTGNPTNYYANPALFIDNQVSGLQDFKIAYAQCAVNDTLESTFGLTNGQIINCASGVEANGQSYLVLNLRNMLFANVETNLNLLAVGEPGINAQNTTFANSKNLVSQNFATQTGPMFINMGNCIMANVTNSGLPSSKLTLYCEGSNNGFYKSFSGSIFGGSYKSTTVFPFQAAGGGIYYLTNGCVFRTAGTTNIDAALLAELSQRTTRAPTVYDATNISGLGMLSPDVARDTNSSPDLGWHYDALDYAFGGCNLSNNLAIASGTAIGLFQDYGGASSRPYGISLGDGANLSISGAATQPCFVAQYAMVQEGGNSGWTNSGLGGLVFNGSGAAPLPQLSANFTKWTTGSQTNLLGGNSAFGLAGFLDCEFYGANLSISLSSVNFTNCILFRDLVDFSDTYTNPAFAFQNCTFYGGGFAMARSESFPSSFWMVEDTTFDGADFSWVDYFDGNSTNTLFDYNAYNTNNFAWTNYPNLSGPSNGTLEVIGQSDVPTRGFNWQPGLLGNFYLPTNSLLVKEGSTNATVLGLAGFTTQTNQMPDGTNIVTIGYHYMAPPVITQEPSACGVFIGDTAAFTVGVIGAEPLNYQWFSNAGPIEGATNAAFILAGAQVSQEGDYWVVVSDPLGSVTSSEALLTVIEPPSIELEPTNQLVLAGNNAYFSATVNGTNLCEGPFAYEWLHNGTNIGQLITTFAGDTTAGYSGDGGQATNAELNYPNSVALDSAGNVYIADTLNNVIRMVNSNGVITTVAGDDANSDSGGQGPAVRAILKTPQGVAMDAQGNLYIADKGNNVVRMVNTNGTIMTVAGKFQVGGFQGDGGQATNAELDEPYGVAVDGHGNLYIADDGNNVIRMVNTNGVITTIAGTNNDTTGGVPGYSGDGGPATNALVDEPEGIALDGSGDLYISDSGNNVIRMVNTNGVITTVAGTNNGVMGGVSGYLGDGGRATNALLNYPEDVAVDTSGNLYIADNGNDAIRMVSTNGIIYTVAGTNNGSGSPDGGYSGDGFSATTAQLQSPNGVAVDSEGNLYITDTGNYVIRMVNTNGTIATVAGIDNQSGGGYSGDSGPATNALMAQPRSILVSPLGNMYFSDSGNDVVRMVNTNGIITTVAGLPSAESYFGDGGPATNAILKWPGGVVKGNDGNLYIADSANDIVRKVDANGLITTVAGIPQQSGYTGDGETATAAKLSDPNGVAVDAFGNLYIADSQNNVIREVNTSGVIETVAGTNSAGPGYLGYSGDGGPATNASLNFPSAVTVDGEGNIYIADMNNDAIRMVNADGIINTIAGTNNGTGSGDGGDSGDGGPATNALISNPAGIALDGYGNLYIADQGNSVVRMVDTNGIITTVAGVPTGPSFGGDFAGDGGLATRAQMDGPGGVAVDSMGHLYIADAENNVIRETVDNFTNLILFNVTTNDLGDYQLVLDTACGSVTSSVAILNPVVPPFVTQPPTNTEVIVGSNTEFSVTATGTPPLGYQWYYWESSEWVGISGATNSTLALDDVQTNEAGEYSVVVTNIAGSTYNYSANLIVIISPVILQQPAAQNALEGNNVTFSVTATSVTPMGYQWYFDSTDLLIGQTNSSLALTNVQSTNAGSYSVVITNCVGSTTSELAVLTVQARPYVVFTGTLTNLTNYVFASDSTYFIDTSVGLYSNTVIEGGSVLKFSTNGTLNAYGPLICKTGPYRVGLLTSMNDDSAGLPIPGSSGDPQTATNGLAYLNFQGWNWSGGYSADATVSYLRFAYADKGLADESGVGTGGTYTGTLHVWNCQFVDCNWGIADWFNANMAAYDLHNVLFGGCQSAFGGWISTNTTVTGEQLTSDTTNFWDTTSNTLTSVSLTNCIILGNFQFNSTTVVSTNCVALASSQSVFQSVGAGNYYLPGYSPYHNAGTTNISAQMRAELAQKTTYAPTVYSDQNLPSQNLVPHVARDTGIAPNNPSGKIAPDLGWNYDPVDYAFSTVNAVNSTISVAPGTVIAIFASYSQTLGDTYGLNIDGGSQFTCQGEANQMNHIVQFNTVQEQATSDWCEAYDGSVVCDFLGGTPSPSLTFRFTDWSIMAFDTYHLLEQSTNCAPVNFQNCCQFHGGLLSSTFATLNFTNCLFERVYTSLNSVDGNTAMILNNLFWHGTFIFGPNNSNSVAMDNLFDQPTIPNNSEAYTNYYGGYNAFITNQDRLYPTNSSDVLLTNSLAYETSYFGDYYQPTNSPLFSAGAMLAANVGLYHYTVLTNQTVEASNTVSIGYHYVACDTNGNPICTSGNGIPDYIADANGNGQGDWADYYRGTLPLLSIVYGDGQYGLLTNFLYAPLVVQVTDDQDNALTNAPLTFSVSNSLAELSLTNTGAAETVVSNLFLRTDQNGFAVVYIYFPSDASATNIIYVTAVSDGNPEQITSTDMVAMVDTPVINPAGGLFTTIQNVAINSDTPGAVVHYTLTGANPTNTDPIITNGQTIAISQATTVEAQGFEDAIMLPSPVQTANFTFANPLAAGSNFTLVLEPYGSILAGGSDGSGQLGNGTTIDNPDLVSVLDITGAAGISAGALHSLAWDTNGNAWSWGDNTDGQLGNGSSGEGTSASTPAQVGSLSSVIAMSAGAFHSLALESNGFVFAWGTNANGELGINSTAQQDSPTQVDIISNIVAIAAGGSHSLALASNGMVYAWGNDTSGQLGNGTTTTTPQETPGLVIDFSNCLEIAAGFSHSLAIASNETVVAWGDNTYGQMGNGRSGNQQSTPAPVPGLSNIVAIAAGQYHNLALSNGFVWAWGNNTYGQLGDGTTATEQTTPVQVVGLSNVLAIAAGYVQSAALLSDGNVVVWGVTNYGMNGTSGNFSTVPVIPDPGTNVNWQPPVIVSQPLSQEVLYGDTVTFSVGAVGFNLTYQWAFNGNPIPGATASSLTINNIQVNNQGAYSVTVANGMASVVSTNAQLTVDWWDATGDPFQTTVEGARQNYTFRSGVTYWIMGPVQLYGQTTIQGGATIKFDYVPWAFPLWYTEQYGYDQYTNPPTLQVLGSLNCKTGPYNLGVLTSVDDDSEGEISQDSSGPYWTGNYPEPFPTGVPFLDLTGATNTCISNLRFAYADQGVATPAGGRLDVWDCQFVTNNSAVMNLAGGTDSFHNVLFSGCGTAVTGSTNSFSIEAEQMTACVTNFWTASNGAPVTVSLTNSIILGTLGTLANSVDVSVNPSSTNFEASDAGSYYLSCNSPLHASGTTAISERLLNEFQNKTTYAPLAFPPAMQMNGTMTLFPRVPRYTSGPPDIGYLYDAVDYLVADMALYGGSVTIEPGTVVGSYVTTSSTNQNYGAIGFDMQNGSSFTSLAMPNKPNVFTDVQTVQEGFEWPAVASFVPDYFPGNGNIDAPPTLNFRFSDFYLDYCGWVNYFPPGSVYGEPADHFWGGETLLTGAAWSYDAAVYLSLQDCKFEGGAIDIGWPDPGYYFPPNYVYGSGSILWVNSSFENVGINISPTWNSYGYFGTENDGPNVNMIVSLDNNLFKGGDWFFIQPIPVSGWTNWLFENNLFDKADFIQDAKQPLDYAYNGYWPKQPQGLLWPGNPDAAELLPTTTGDGFTDAQGEVTLSNAPPYQCGPFGKFYMPTNTPLFGAGSTSVTNLALFHYTTRPDQTIEGDAPAWHTNVDIGVHYVPATNLPSTSGWEPVDTDGDGIPDYVEDADGDGIVDTNDGTDWTTPYTLPGIWDPTNSVYMNTDLSGDGLVNSIKLALGLGPFCQTNPLTLTQIITGQEPGTATFSLPISYNAVTNIGMLELLVDGSLPNYQECLPATNGNCLLTWDTAYTVSGQHLVQAKFILTGGGHALGPICLLTFTNICQFDPQYSYFTAGGATLYATTPRCSNAQYTINIYDPSTCPPTLVKTLAGSTSTGVIQTNWDLTYNDGTTLFTNTFVNAVFNVNLLGSDSGKATQSLPMMGPLYDGNFTVAFAWDESQYTGPNGTMYNAVQTVVNCLLSASAEPIIYGTQVSFYSSKPYSSSYNSFNWTLGASGGNPGFVNSPSDAQNLLSNLKPLSNRNFFWEGHGTNDPPDIGNNERAFIETNPNAPNPTITPNPTYVDIPAMEIASDLNNLGWLPKHGYSHPYRFVFLDACETADDDRFAEAFGIIAPDTETQLGNWKVQAFVGWVGSPRAPNSDAEWSEYTMTLYVFFSSWMQGSTTLAACLNKASNPDPYGNGSLILDFPLGIKYTWFQQHIGGYSNSFHWKIYGYPNITRLSNQ
jgi:trimeric autotransporter adhesin